jgi:hypothetical protein
MNMKKAGLKRKNECQKKISIPEWADDTELYIYGNPYRTRIVVS